MSQTEARVYRDYRSEVIEHDNRPWELRVIQLKRWVCHGQWGVKSHHATEELALKAAEADDAFNKKYPFKCPRSKKERERTKRYCPRRRHDAK